MLEEIYITQSGTLSKKDNSLLFENETTKKVLPIDSIKNIYALSEINVNSKLLQFLTKKGIVLHFFNYYEFYVGSYYPKENLVSGNLLVKQVEFSINNDKRTIIAKKIVEGIGKNIIEVLRHYTKHGKDEVQNFISNIRKELKKLESPINNNDVLKIMNIEGTIWNNFYSSFKYFIHEDFILNKRVKNPPDNPINALISFGNSMLYALTLSKIYETQLNPTIAYLHSNSEKRFSLCLDLSEVFKPILTFQLIFKLVNKKIIQVEKHFDKDLNYSLLNEEGRKIFLKYWDEKIHETVFHEGLKRNVSYKTLIKFEGYKLIKHLIGDKEFKPYFIENKE